ncbi:hypothetical protein QWY85_13750 [Neolewinella lacunae]|uniref:DUF3829 domain-containing protein n=1 Tax=Neolewinella lacunae TaxID=1517758 RepID=A0A923PFP0_9BACT|nr:hypothetical protein [Neolewinella lacunae]MBC6993225.1 hypothetical protein [Neolewinella lacunae]MDN3635728.1 hypothetical protein [Neolewinella lacunae]
MTKYFTSLLLFLFVLAGSASAQEEMTKPSTNRGSDVATAEDYQRIFKNSFNVELRALAIEALELDEKQTTAFTPIFLDYTQAKNGLMTRRTTLLDDYREEMKEDDTAEDEREETADFIENYWEIDIAEMELQKDYFDRFEDVITGEKALEFFALERMYQNRLNRTILMEKVPTIRYLVPSDYSYQWEMDQYKEWKKVNIDGKVSLDHKFTSTGLSKLLNAAEAMTQAEGIKVNNFDQRKAMVMKKADQLRDNWKSTEHADYARAAFVETASILQEIAQSDRFMSRKAWTDQLSANAKAIKPDVKLTAQADKVYNFFDTAETIVNDLVEQANKQARK